MANSFRNRLLLAVIVLLVMTQGVTTAAVFLATDNNLGEQSKERLGVGRRVFEQLLATREDQLVNTAEVLASDFGFKRAVATGDRRTIVSALTNHGARVGADLMMLVSLEGKLVASSHHETDGSVPFPFPKVLARADRQGQAYASIMVKGVPFQVVLVPVKAPHRIAWTCIGFAIDQALAAQLKSLTRLDVSFWGRPVGGEPEVFASTLAPPARRELAGLLATARPGSFQAPHAMGERRFLSLQSELADGRDYHITALLDLSLAEAMSAFDGLKLQMAAIFGLALAVSVALAFFIARSVSQPLLRIVRAANRIEQGDYEAPVEARGADEIKRLAGSLDEMRLGIAEREERIRYQADHDLLTDLPNRNCLADYLADRLADPDCRCLALLSVNIRDFKQINDTFGYDYGDEVLKTVAARLRHLTGNLGLVARIGADEFMVCLDDCNESRARTRAQQYVQELERAVQVDSLEMQVSVALGIALAPDHGDEREALLRRCDIAMHTAKDERRGVAMYQPGQEEAHLARIALVAELGRAIADDALSLYYQPKKDLRTGRVDQAEALIRWNHPEKGFIPPDQFIPVAEQSGSIAQLTHWVIDRSLRQIKSFAESGLELTVSINVSAHDLSNDMLADTLLDKLRQYQLPAERLVLEITESAVMDDSRKAIAQLARLREHGFRMAIDDFGTGYSSLGQLKDLPVSELKIDKSFVLHLSERPDDAKIVRSTIELGHNLGLEVIAEGVEDQTAEAMLTGYGCNLIQGFFLGKPMPAEQFAEWLRERDAGEGASSQKPG